MHDVIHIGTREISEDAPAYLIAEMSANHNMDYGRALRIIDAAAYEGADAVKIQTYTADTITLDSDAKPFWIDQGTLWDGMTLHKLYEKAYTPWEWQPGLREHALEKGIELFSSPFDHTSVDFLEKMDVPAYKIASYEITDIALIRKAASLGKPVIISTGVAELSDIEKALDACRKENNEDVILLKCVSAYPTPYEDMNLKSMLTLKREFGCITGLSDHSMGSVIAQAAVAMGAKVIEKHLTLRRADGGVDSAFSMEPEEFRQMRDNIRTIEAALGSGEYRLTKKQQTERGRARSLFIAADMKAGDVFTPDNVRSVRPGDGLAPEYYEEILGKRITKDAVLGTPLSWDLIENGQDPA